MTTHRDRARLRLDATAMVDAISPAVAPASLLLDIPAHAAPRIEGAPALLAEPGEIVVLAAGSPAQVDQVEGARSARRLRLPGAVLTPGFVNAHAHLDLTHIGPQPISEQGFPGFVELIRRERHTEEDQIAASVSRGIALSLAGGVVAIGDIAGAPMGRPSLVPWRTLRASPLAGVSYLEFFAIGKGAARGRDGALAGLRQAIAEAGGEATSGRLVLGLSPHATNTVSLASYRWACGVARAHGVRLTSHVAETLEEREFIARGSGPQRELLERVGVWDDDILNDIGQGRTPLAHVMEVFRECAEGVVGGVLAAHCNDLTDDDVGLLVQRPGAGAVRIAYCPRASRYFGAPERFGPHRYQALQAQGVPVALGTDSIVNLWEGASSVSRLSPLDDARLLVRHDGLDPRRALAMLTLQGAKALGLNPETLTFAPGVKLAGIVAIEVGGTAGLDDPAKSVMLSDSAPQLLLIGK
jgi:cytosine/adenosine deaminase-related metal-dependent hydrolase